MNEADILRERAEQCTLRARSLNLASAVRELEAQAREFIRRAVALEALHARLQLR
jgi:hypothetical protein